MLPEIITPLETGGLAYQLLLATLERNNDENKQKGKFKN